MSLYQVNTGFIIAVLLAFKIAVLPEQVPTESAIISAAVADELTVTVTILASVGLFSQKSALCAVT